MKSACPSLICGIICAVLALLWESGSLWDEFLTSRCLLENNYFIMEATRPVTECDMCKNVSQPVILINPSPEEFQAVAYSSRPILVKGATQNWSALHVFSLEFFAQLYTSLPGALDSVDEECQFFPFRTEFVRLLEVFDMPPTRARLEPGEKPWYIGWSNCHPDVKSVLRSHYQRPAFLPRQSEASCLDWIFIGGPGPASSMHLDYVQRPSWQAQIVGRKFWRLLPPPECEAHCSGLNITVETGDIVMIDTNQWYHDTYVLGPGLSITIGSEYD